MVDMHTIKALDKEAGHNAAKTSRVVAAQDIICWVVLDSWWAPPLPTPALPVS